MPDQPLRRWHDLGANLVGSAADDGVRFAVWAPRARAVSVVGSFCDWEAGRWPLTRDAAGVWRGRVPGIGPGALYKYAVDGADGRRRLKADPWGRRMERPPATASVVIGASSHAWQDDAWLARRAAADPLRDPMRVYEVHLGSWRRRADGSWLSYAELGPMLAEHCTALGFTHLELLPIAEHPYDGSWGYQVTGYFAPTARFGAPDELRAMIDLLHRSGIGVLLDWVPGHFPRDEHGLAAFDGTPLYEPADPKRANHPDWGTLTFDLAKPEVRDYLTDNARYWIEEFHVDGLRVDAVASMLYLDYSRRPGQWTPNRLGGNTDLDAIDFLRQLTDALHAETPGIVLCAEESTAFPGVSRPTADNGLGFDLKWDLGWMHDTLDFLRRPVAERARYRGRLTFRGLYLHAERWLLPLSHDEVVHGKGSLLRKMAGSTDGERFASLRCLLANQLAQPGKQLLFMGTELGPDTEWDHDHALPWAIGDDPLRRGLRQYLVDMAALYRSSPALWAAGSEAGSFTWIDLPPAAGLVLGWIRRAGDDQLVILQNFGAAAPTEFHVGLPQAGAWVAALRSDARAYGGPADGFADQQLAADGGPMHGQPASARIDLPALTTLVLRPA